MHPYDVFNVPFLEAPMPEIFYAGGMPQFPAVSVAA